MIVFLDYLSKEKEKYKFICDDLDSTFSELTGYWTGFHQMFNRLSLIEFALRKYKYNPNPYVYWIIAFQVRPEKKFTLIFYTISIYLIDSTIDTMHQNAVPQI